MNPAPQLYTYQREQAMNMPLKPLDAQLQHTGQLGGQASCAADIAIFPFVRQFAAVEPACTSGNRSIPCMHL